MKKLLKSSLLTLASFALLTGANAKTLENGVLKIATEGTYSPYSYHDKNDALTGYDVEVAREVAKKLNLKVEFVEAPWDAMLAAFDAGKADIVFNQVSITDERKKKYDYTAPYTVAYAALVTHKDNNEIKSFEDLKGKKSAHSATSNWAGIAQKYGAQIVTVDGFSKGVELIISRRADATINDSVTLKIAASGSEPIYSAAIVKKGNEELVNDVNRALSELKSEGKLKEISVKYFGKDISE